MLTDDSIITCECEEGHAIVRSMSRFIDDQRLITMARGMNRSRLHTVSMEDSAHGMASELQERTG